MIGLRASALAISAWVCMATPQDQHPVFRTETDIISIPISVMSDRKPVAGLKATDFSLTDNGVAQTISEIYSATVPLDVTLVVDTSGSVEGAKEALARDVQRITASLEKEDRVRVLAMDRATHEDVALQPVGPNVLTTFHVRGGISGVHDAIFAALLQKPSPGRRQVIVAITDAFDTASQTSPATLVALGDIPGPALHIVLVNSAQMPSEVQERSSRLWFSTNDFAIADLQKAARKTGGALHRTGLLQRSATGFAIDILKMFRQSYLLLYSPKGVDAPGQHVVQVTIPRHPGYEITARRSYEK